MRAVWKPKKRFLVPVQNTRRHENKKYFQSQQKGQKGGGGSEGGEVMAVLLKKKWSSRWDGQWRCWNPILQIASSSKNLFSQNWATLVSLLRLFTFSMSKPHADSRSRTVVTPLVKTVDSWIVFGCMRRNWMASSSSRLRNLTRAAWARIASTAASLIRFSHS